MTRIKLQYVHEYVDRTGVVRRYFRKRGQAKTPLPGVVGSEEFMQAYQQALHGTASRPSRYGTNTIGRLVTDFYRSAEFANLKASSKDIYRRVLERIVIKHGGRSVTGLTGQKARHIIEEIGQSKHGMANLTRKILRRVMSYAVATDVRPDNPFVGVKTYKGGTRHTWTDDQLAAYEAKWPFGSRERLAYEALLRTCQRGGDVVRMRRPESKATSITVIQQKTGEEVTIPIHPTLWRAIKAGPSNGLWLVGDGFGRPVKRQTLTRIIREAAKAAGLPAECVAHGLRKAGLRLIAEHGGTEKELSSVSGHKSLAEVARYTAKANQAKLAKSGLKKVPVR